MTAERLSEAQREVSAAAMFGRKPAQWAVRAVEADKASRRMTYAEAMDVERGGVFGRVSDPAKLAEARVVIAEDGASLREFDVLQGKLAQLAEAKLHMNQRNAALHAQSEALACRAGDWTVAESVTKLQARFDALASAVQR